MSALPTESRRPTRVRFRSRSQEAVLGLFRANDALRRWFSAVVEPAGITIQQYHVLRILRRAGPEGLPTLAIAQRLAEHAPGITRLLDRLEEHGWVRRTRSAVDRRQVVCHLTPAGRSLLAALDGPVDAADDRCLAMLGPEDLDALIRILGTIREHYEHHDAEGPTTLR